MPAYRRGLRPVLPFTGLFSTELFAVVVVEKVDTTTSGTLEKVLVILCRLSSRTIRETGISRGETP